MLILALESSAKAASVALMEDEKLIAQYSQCSGLTHSRTLLPMVDDMLKNTENTVAGVDLIAVAHGPGSFTGIRIGVSTVKGLAWAADKMCVGVSTLAAMAWHGVSAGGIICPVMDARRSQVYNALFSCKNGTIERLTDDRAVSLEELENELKSYAEPKIFLGDGAQLCYNTIGTRVADCRCAPEQLRMQRASGVALAANALLLSGQSDFSGAALTPNYLRLSQAERERAERLRQSEGGA